MKIKDQERLMAAVKRFLKADAALTASLASYPAAKRTTKKKIAALDKQLDDAAAELKEAKAMLSLVYGEIDLASRA